MKKLLGAVLAIGILAGCQDNPGKNHENDKTETPNIEKTNGAKTKPEKTPEKTPDKDISLTKEGIKKLASLSGKADLKEFEARISYFLGYNIGNSTANSILNKGRTAFKTERFFKGYSDCINGKKSEITVTHKNRKDIKADPEKDSYMVGFVLGMNHLASEIEIVLAPFAKGLNHALVRKKSQLTAEEMTNVYREYKKLQEEKRKKRWEAGQKVQAKNLVDGKKYLNDNKNKKGVVTTKSGLQYKVIKAGTRKRPSKTDTVKVHYRGMLISGKEFDSSYKRGEPAEFALSSVSPGWWTEGLQLMKVGAKFEFTIPADIAYGKGGPGGGNAVLLFTVELLEVIKKKESNKNNSVNKTSIPDIKKPKETNKKSKYTTTASGLQYLVLKKGTGKSPKATDMVEVHYEGKFLSGKIFDSSYKRKQTSSFRLNEVIPGWTEGLQLMKEGAKYKFIIPSNLAYGPNDKRGIPGGSTLIFIVELIKVK